MARPKKQPHELRTARCDVRVTQAEKDCIDQLAADSGLEPSEYVRRRALRAPAPPRPSGRIDPALITEVNRLGVQVSGLGNVVNQVARYLHTDRPAPPEYDHLPQEIRRTQAEISGVLERLVLGVSPESAEADE